MAAKTKLGNGVMGNWGYCSGDPGGGCVWLLLSHYCGDQGGCGCCAGGGGVLCKCWCWLAGWKSGLAELVMLYRAPPLLSERLACCNVGSALPVSRVRLAQQCMRF